MGRAITSGGSEWFTRIGAGFYADPKVVGPELQRRKTDSQVTKQALFRANRGITPLPTTANNPETDAHRDLVEALRDIRKAALFAAAMAGEDDGKPYAMIADRADAALTPTKEQQS